ncbi:MAG TPA: hypothetical protein VF488_04940 [Gemmatimonadaceae bacterium]
MPVKKRARRRVTLSMFHARCALSFTIVRLRWYFGQHVAPPDHVRETFTALCHGLGLDAAAIWSDEFHSRKQRFVA